MRNTKMYSKCHYRTISLAVLAIFLLTCGVAQAQVATGTIANEMRPEIKQKLEGLRQEVAEKGYTFTVGYNPAMERTISELAGLVVPKDWRKHAKFENLDMNLTATPTSFDWRSVPGVTMSVKNQGACGSCWAFGTVAPLEPLISFYCGETVDLSEQYLVSCNESGWGCQGGWFAHDYHEWWAPASKGETEAGAVLEGSFPYQAANVSCNGPHAHPYKIADWRFIGGYAVPTPAAIKQAIQTYGPVSVGVCVGSKFAAYRSGIFNANETCSGTVNHAVALVGWVDDLGVDKGYWILKNSWGTGWGEGGYMRIRYGISKVGFAANYVDFSSANCPNQPEGFDCTKATTIGLGTITGQTTDADQNGSITYGCSGRVESGPRKIYKVTTTGSGDLSAAVSNASADLDVFILKACNPSSCATFGEDTATYLNAPAGTYYIVVDTKTASEAVASFDLTVSLAQPLPDLTGTWTQLTSGNKGRRVYGTLKVSNIGNANAGAFKVAYYLSSDGTTLGRYLGYQYLSRGLSAGAYSYLFPRFSSSSSLMGQYLIAKVDSDGKVVEKDENNQVAGLVK